MKQTMPEISKTKPIEKWNQVTDREVPGVIPYYYISDFGRITSIGKTKDPDGFLSIFMSGHGYLYAQLKLENGKYFAAMLHTLVLKSFGYVDGCENMIANHIDGIKTHNWIWNLEWVTHAQNIMHANILFNRYGDGSANNKLCREQVITICNLLDCGCRAKDIKRIMNLSVDDATVRNIYNGITWIDESIKYSFLYKSIGHLFTYEQLIEIITMLNNDINITAEYIINHFNIDITLMSNNQIRQLFNLINKIRYDFIGKNLERSYNYLGSSTTSQ